MSDNLALWNAVERTDPSQTKPIMGKPYRGTSPKPYYIVRKATDTFGPCGIGWGFSIISERVEDGAPGDKIHIAHVRVWYIWNGVRGEIEHVGQTMFAGKRADRDERVGGPYSDEDAPKKSVTDALIKALSMIGFAGDIFMGRYDDSKYVAELREEERANNIESDTIDQSVRAYASRALENISTFPTKGLLDAWWKNNGHLRAELGIVEGTPTYLKLIDACKTQSAKIADRNRVLA